MEKMLIYTDTRAVNRIMERVSKLRNALNNVYKEFTAFDVSVSIAELFSTVEYGSYEYERNAPKLADLLRERLLDKINPNTVISGITLSRKKLAEMVELPNLNQLNKAFKIFCETLRDNSEAVDRNYYVISGDEISTVPDLETQLTERHSYYATTIAQKAAAEKLIALADALNEHKKLPLLAQGDYIEAKGILWEDGQYRPDRYLIQRIK